MRMLILSVSAIALLAPVAHAQQSAATAKPAATASASSHDMVKFLVFFDWDKATLTNEARSVIANAAETYKKTGSARIVATGYTDRSGSAAYNLRLSVRRAQAVAAELVRRGVPASSIVTVGKGEENPLVPTADGVREPQNRRVEIEVPRPPAPPAPPPPPAPVPAPVAAKAPPPSAKLGWVSVGAFYGYSLRETDASGQNKRAQLVGPEVTAGYEFSPGWAVNVAGAGFNTIGTSASDGWGARGALGLIHLFDTGTAFRPYIGPNVGYYYGKGVQDGLLVGPQIGMQYDVSDSTFIGAKIGYDTQPTRNAFRQGVPNAGLNVGFRF